MTSPGGNQIHLTTGSRLHCGLFSDPGKNGYRFQGLGIMLDSPGYHISASRLHKSVSEHLVHADKTIQSRIANSLREMENSFGNPKKHFLEIRVEKSIPLHCGFGGGTQLAIAIGKTWAKFHQPELTTQQIAIALQRGKRSCIGTFGFDTGGLLIDRGITANQQFGQCAYQTLLPESWRVLLIRPLQIQGLSGESETKAFQSLPELNEQQLARLQNLLEIIKNKSQCFETLSAALREYGLLIGDTFAAVQGGCFSAKICQAIFNFLTKAGLQGIAQSSWGPTMFGLCENEQQAVELKSLANKNIPNLEISISRISNPKRIIKQ